ncbi:MAG: hypothetical protein H6850_02770 [Alphaproteobacteria bacterium]|nr:MAG: hypothetical protein H6850_02770 [Alphaproteobacteria bacterium]
MYKSGDVEVNYRGELYKTDYLDWYKQAVEKGGHATPTWVIDINQQLASDIKNNTNFYPIYATTIKFTSEFLFAEHHLDPLQMKRSENVVMKPTLVVIPHGFCFATLSDYQKRQVPVPITIKKFINCDKALIDHSRYDFQHAIINHVDLINGDEIAVIFTCYNISIQESIYNNAGVYLGNVVKDLNYAPLKSLVSKGVSVVADEVV